MTTSVSNIGPIPLYRMMLKAAKGFPQYNIREYAIRKIKHSFREAKNCPYDETQRLIKEGIQSLNLLKRQSIIYSQYYNPPSN